MQKTLLVFASIFLLCGSNAKCEITHQCGVGKHYVKSHFRKAYTRSDGVHFKATTVKEHCADNPKNYDFWNPKLKNGRPDGWARKTEKSKHWSTEEREKTLEALSKMPPALMSAKLREIDRMIRSQDFPNPASSDNGDIVLYDTAFEKDKSLTQILSHELAHQYYKNLSGKDFESYRKAADWFNISNLGTKPVYRTAGRMFVAKDGVNSIEEDFANNIEYFLNQPKELKKSTPKVYDWISNHFGDKFKLGAGGAHVR